MGHRIVVLRTRRHIDHTDRDWEEICSYIYEHRRARGSWLFDWLAEMGVYGVS